MEKVASGVRARMRRAMAADSREVGILVEESEEGGFEKRYDGFGGGGGGGDPSWPGAAAAFAAEDATRSRKPESFIVADSPLDLSEEVECLKNNGKQTTSKEVLRGMKVRR